MEMVIRSVDINFMWASPYTKFEQVKRSYPLCDLLVGFSLALKTLAVIFEPCKHH